VNSDVFLHSEVSILSLLHDVVHSSHTTIIERVWYLPYYSLEDIMLPKKSYAQKMINSQHHAFPQSRVFRGNLCITRHHDHDNSFNVNEIFGRIQSHRNNMLMFFLRDTQSTRMYSDSGWHVGEEMEYQCNVGE
jgi:hypothetical protein